VDPSTKNDYAEYVNRFHARLHDLIREQFSRSTLLAVSSAILLMLLFAGLVFLSRPTSVAPTVERLGQSTARLGALAMQLARTHPPSDSTLLGPLIDGITHEQQLDAALVEQARTSLHQLPPEGGSLLQLVGGTAILALLGFLGLQRLQNIDTEIQGLREFMFTQIQERVQEGREVLKASVDDEVDSRFHRTQEELETLVKKAEGSSMAAHDQFSKATMEAMHRLEEIEARTTAVFNRYAWLNSPEVRASADELANLASTEQAHDAAVKFRLAGDLATARSALRQISARNLPGGYDDYHNALVEAQRLKDPDVALEIVDQGLSRFPDQYDLMADKAQVLTELGKAEEAKTLLKEFLLRRPSEFGRGWRPAVFFVDSVRATKMNDADIEAAETAMKTVTEKLPHSTQTWARYARFEEELGRRDKARELLEEALKLNPYCQVLHYIMGGLMLENGAAAEAIPYLENALRYDFQEQFQHDVSQDAIKCRLAQAYEASGATERAMIIYRRLAKSSEGGIALHLGAYVRNRMRAVGTLMGDEAMDEGGVEEFQRHMLDLLMQKRQASAEGEAEPEGGKS
jgi:tetratricopeptide (TPR) repeat protein